MTEDSRCITHEPCPSCGSTDNLARYDDGHGYCFGCGYYERGDGSTGSTESREAPAFDPVRGEYRALVKRGISMETCRKYGYQVVMWSGSPAHACDVRDREGKLIAQKIRTPDKDFCVNGKLSDTLIGSHLFSGGKKLVITEGEIDMLTMSQIQGNKWPVVSLPLGAKSAKKTIAANLDYLSNFEEVILCFDMDDPGQEAVQAAAELLMGHNVKIMKLPLKDPNDMLLAQRVDELISAMWNAEEFRPDGLVDIEQLFESACEEIEQGIPWFLPSLTKATFGRRPGELYGLGAGTGMGKTDWFTQQIAYDIYELKQKTAVFYLEQAPKETLRRIVGKRVGEPLHVPSDHRNRDYLLKTMGPYRRDTAVNLQLYDNFGVANWDRLKSKIIYLASKGYKGIYIDHLTALATGGDKDEKSELEHIMADMASVGKRYGLVIHFISHLTTPEGKPHEEGGRVTIRQFKGSRAIGFWSYYLFGMERDQQATDELTRTTTLFRILKDRFTGQATGLVIPLGYDSDTGRLFEREDTPDSNPFEEGEF